MKDLTTKWDIISWAQDAFYEADDGDGIIDRWPKPKALDTAAYLAECVRLRRAMDLYIAEESTSGYGWHVSGEELVKEMVAAIKGEDK